MRGGGGRRGICGAAFYAAARPEPALVEHEQHLAALHKANSYKGAKQGWEKNQDGTADYDLTVIVAVSASASVVSSLFDFTHE